MSNETEEFIPKVDFSANVQLSMERLRDTGMLYLINKTVFHPRGFSLALHLDKDEKVIGWTIVGDGSEPWTFGGGLDEDELFRKANAFLNFVGLANQKVKE